MAGPVVQGPGVDWQCPASLVGFDPTLLICEKKRGVEPPRRSCPKEPLGRGSSGRFPKQKGPRSLWHPGAARYGHLTGRARLRTFERSIVGSTTNLADPTWRKANFLWKFLCAGAAIPDCGGDPIPTAVPPARIFAEQQCLAAAKDCKFAARQSDRCTNCKPVCNCNPERECFLKPQKIISLVRHCMPRTHGISKGSADPFVMLRGKRNESNFFPAARHRASLRS